MYVLKMILITNCFETSTFDLIVLPLPAILVPTPLYVCDDDGDGFGSFTLTDKNAEILMDRQELM